MFLIDHECFRRKERKTFKKHLIAGETDFTALIWNSNKNTCLVFPVGIEEMNSISYLLKHLHLKLTIFNETAQRFLLNKTGILFQNLWNRKWDFISTLKESAAKIVSH